MRVHARSSPNRRTLGVEGEVLETVLTALSLEFSVNMTSESFRHERRTAIESRDIKPGGRLVGVLPRIRLIGPSPSRRLRSPHLERCVSISVRIVCGIAGWDGDGNVLILAIGRVRDIVHEEFDQPEHERCALIVQSLFPLQNNTISSYPNRRKC